MSLSVIVITLNASRSIGACLASVSFADEIIVLDSGSTDNTLELCRRYTEKVHSAATWPGFGPQKNRALEMAAGEWVLSLDADERVTDELQTEIKAALADPGDKAAFAMPRLSSYCGRFMRHSGWRPDYVIRLFRRGRAHFSNDLVHERLLVKGTTSRFVNPLIHEAFADLDEVLQKLNRYSTDGARMMFQQRRKATLATALAHGFWTFVQTYLMRAGFLDGREGFMLAVSNAEGTYYRYLKLMLMNEKK